MNHRFTAGMTRPFIYLLVGSLIFVLAIVGFCVMVAEPEDFGTGFWVSLLFPLALTLLLVIPMLFAKTHIEVREEEVFVRTFGFFQTSIKYSEIESLEVGPVTGLKYGAGLRILPDATGYLTGGPSIRITSTGRQPNIIASAEDPQAVIDAVRVAAKA